MYETVAHMRTKAGYEDALRSLIQEWNTERQPQVPGALTGYLFKLDRDPQEWILVALFQDKASYQANDADDPEQDRWYKRFVEHLEGEPQWHDGEAF